MLSIYLHISIYIDIRLKMLSNQIRCSACLSVFKYLPSFLSIIYVSIYLSTISLCPKIEDNQICHLLDTYESGMKENSSNLKFKKIMKRIEGEKKDMTMYDDNKNRQRKENRVREREREREG